MEQRPVPPRGAPGGSERRALPRGETRPLGLGLGLGLGLETPPLPRVRVSEPPPKSPIPIPSDHQALPLGQRLDLLLAQCGLPLAADSPRQGEAACGSEALSSRRRAEDADADLVEDAGADAEVARVAAAYGVSYPM